MIHTPVLLLLNEQIGYFIQFHAFQSSFNEVNNTVIIHGVSLRFLPPLIQINDLSVGKPGIMLIIDDIFLVN